MSHIDDDMLYFTNNTLNLQKEIRLYTTKRNKQPFNQWLNGLKDATIRAKVRARLDRLSLGNYGDSKSINKDIKELRLNFGPGYRIYFVEQSGVLIVLLCGGSKRTQKKDIAKAKQYCLELITGEK